MLTDKIIEIFVLVDGFTKEFVAEIKKHMIVGLFFSKKSSLIIIFENDNNQMLFAA